MKGRKPQEARKKDEEKCGKGWRKEMRRKNPF